MRIKRARYDVKDLKVVVTFELDKEESLEKSVQNYRFQILENNKIIESLKLSKTKPKKIEESVKLRGNVSYVLKDRNGKVKDKWQQSNIVTNIGKAEIANLVIGGGTSFGYIAIGTGTGFNAASTGLNTETHRLAAALSRTTTTVANDTARFFATFTFAADYTISESGVFNASGAGAGIMLCGQNLASPRSVTVGDQLECTWTVCVS